MGSKFNPILDLVINSEFQPYTFWVMYGIIFILSVISYKLGFAKELPILKSIIVYILLVVGTFITTLFSILQLPIAESLVIITLVLAIYRFRLHRERQSRHKQTQEENTLE